MATKAIEGGTLKRRIRKIFGNIHEVVQMPNLIEVQRESYEQFLRSDPATGYVSGLEKTLRSVFPIRDFAGTAELDFVHYELEDAQVRHRRVPPARHHLCGADARHAAPDRVRGRPRYRDPLGARYQGAGRLHGRHAAHDARTAPSSSTAPSASSSRRCTVRRACCSTMTAARPTPRASILFAARVIPYRGSWLDFEFDAKDIVNVRIDRKRKLPVTALLYALGLNGEEILNHFYNTRRPGSAARAAGSIPFVAEQWRGQKPTFDIVDAKIRRSHLPRRPEDQPARRQQGGRRTASPTLLIPTEEIFGRYSRLRPDQRDDRRDLHRGRRRSVARESREARQGRHRPDRTARHRPRQRPARGSATR